MLQYCLCHDDHWCVFTVTYLCERISPSVRHRGRLTARLPPRFVGDVAKAMGDAQSTVKRYCTETLEPGTGKRWFEVRIYRSTYSRIWTDGCLPERDGHSVVWVGGFHSVSPWMDFLSSLQTPSVLRNCVTTCSMSSDIWRYRGGKEHQKHLVLLIKGEIWKVISI
jgi:hypothetical protein